MIDTKTKHLLKLLRAQLRQENDRLRTVLDVIINKPNLIETAKFNCAAVIDGHKKLEDIINNMLEQ